MPYLPTTPPRSDSLPLQHFSPTSTPLPISPPHQPSTPPSRSPYSTPTQRSIYPTQQESRRRSISSRRLSLGGNEIELGSPFSHQHSRYGSSDMGMEEFEDDLERGQVVQIAERRSFRPPGLVPTPAHPHPPSQPYPRQSPPSFQTTPSQFSIATGSPPASPDPSTPPPPKKPAIKPSLALLFSLKPMRSHLPLLVPALFFTALVAAVPPYMTEVMGSSFGAFTLYALAIANNATPDEIAAAKVTLLHSARIVSLKFAGLAALMIISGLVSVSLWITHGERVARDLRLEVYRGISSRDMEWFDLGSGAAESTEEELASGDANGEGAGGLMGRFAKETDEVRVACSNIMGFVVQGILSFVACLAISLYRNYQLTLVILLSVPVMLTVVAVTEGLAGNLMMADKTLSAKSTARADRVIGAMPTVKAFNAQAKELEGFKTLTGKVMTTYNRLCLIWGIRLGLVQFTILSMFVSGFWFGAHLVQTGKATPGAVSTCFWACVLATSFLQAMVPMLLFVEKGKVAMANLLDLARAAPEPVNIVVRSPNVPGNSPLGGSKFAFRGGGASRRGSDNSGKGFAHDGAPPGQQAKADEALGAAHRSLSPHPFQVTFPSSPSTPNMPSTPIMIPLASAFGQRAARPALALRKLRPATFTGELGLKHVTFHYPSRPHPAPPALDDVSLYLAACETTYIVGGSGSGKSTVASLLLGMYRPDSGQVEVEEQGLEWIEEGWLRGHVACVSQGVSVLFDGSVHDNVAVGVVGQIRADGTSRDVKDVTREEVIAACRGALIHEFVRDLPDGYDTFLSGERGASLSGGQRQRLAIARAWIRKPTVLILDEATSALDATSRLLVSEAVKLWRKNQTTIVITHDLTPISDGDFVYVMADGRVVEQGYRKDLEANTGGPFHSMAHSQGSQAPSTGPEYDYEYDSDDDVEDLEASLASLGLDSQYSTNDSSPIGSARPASPETAPRIPKHGTFLSPSDSEGHRASRSTLRLARQSLARPSQETFSSEGGRSSHTATRPSSHSNPSPSQHNSFLNVGLNLFAPPSDTAQASRDLREARRASSRFESNSARRKSLAPQASFPSYLSSNAKNLPELPPPMYDYTRYASQPHSQRDSSLSFPALEFVANQAAVRRPANNRVRHATMVPGDSLASEWKRRDGLDASTIDVGAPTGPVQMTLREVFKRYYWTIPSKGMFWFGLVVSVGVGACTPVFSFLLAKLMTHIGDPKGGPVVTRTALMILALAFIDGSGQFLKFYVLERCAQEWICKLRVEAFDKITRQEKAWLDGPENSTGTLASMLIKDTEDARNLVGTVIGQLLVVISMISIGLIWAFVAGWELTLVGVALAPVFIITTRVQANIQTKFEGENKGLREDLSVKFHQSVSNIRAIRSMSIEKVFATKFERAVQETYAGAIKAAPFSGFGFALGGSLTYFAEALMFYVGALLIISGRYTFGKMVEVFTLIMFSITFSSQIMTTLPGMAKAIRAAIDFARLLDLPIDTRESEGRMTFPIGGHLVFDKVEFAYPARPDAKILKGMTFEIKPGECVGIVGASGSGKSTVTTLLQRLYEPDAGLILLDGRPLSRVDVHYLRDHVAVVSQHPALFDMSIHENIAYGQTAVTEDEVIRAAQAAHVHDFIMTLPKGYQTMLGENASLISGGQAQRLQIARALVRHREILILDECTSALDAVNQAAVMETILSVKQGKTTIIVTHKLDVMKECDRLLVLDTGGVVAESGTFAELRARRGGLFATLASAGEWEHQ
ncbi:hypothetical protein RQP46_002776 [Phenoliferia psychrophenolica]